MDKHLYVRHNNSTLDIMTPGLFLATAGVAITSHCTLHTDMH